MRDLTTADRRAARERFLASVWRELASSSDWEVPLARLARLAVPECADWCFLHIAEAAGSAHSVHIAYACPESAALAERLRRDQPTGATPAWPLWPQWPKIMLVPNVDQSRLAEVAREHLDVLNAIRPQSFLVVPINVHSRPFAVLTFAYTQRSGRRYGADDIAWALNLAAQARLAIERAALRHELETASLAKEQFLAACRTN